MTEQLKPCPFCGSADLSVISFDYKCYAVECNNCGAIGRFKETNDDAKSAWNSRIDKSQPSINELQVQDIEEALQVIKNHVKKIEDAFAKLNNATKQLRAKHD